MRTILAVLLALFAPASVKEQQSYFTPGSFDRNPQIDQRDVRWFSSVLQKAQETSFLNLSEDPSAESYRFLWLRTFDPPIIVRLDLNADGSSILTTKVGHGASGFPYTVTKEIENSSRSISLGQTQNFQTLVDKNGFWSVPSYVEGDQTGTDGSEWVMEAVKQGKYHVAHRWSPLISQSPSNQAVRELGLALAIQLGQLRIPKGHLD